MPMADDPLRWNYSKRGGVDRAALRGEREQKALLRTMIGDTEARIGDSAAHVSRVA
jgi:hypothetical protein